MKITFKTTQSTIASHHCKSKRKGEWIVFTCPHCPDYERHLNWKTGEMKSFVSDNNRIKHSGSFIPIGLEGDYSTAN